MSANKSDSLSDDAIKSTSQTAIIPDFFHDIIAYLIPGLTVFILVLFDAFLLSGNKIDLPFSGSAYFDFFILLVVAYVIGRLFESVGYSLIHRCGGNPKYNLLFNEKSDDYTVAFKNNVIEKIVKHLDNQNGKDLIEQCKKKQKDDYFNIIQYYLRERFPSVAYYEKKQNAVKVSSRSLSIIFGVNSIFILHYLLFESFSSDNIFQGTAPIFLSLFFTFWPHYFFS